MEKQKVIMERIFRADRQLVWRAITEKEMMKEWYFDLAAFEAVVGFTFEFIGCTEEETQYKHLCDVTEVIPEHKLTYSWRYDGYEGISYVTFELFDEQDGTRLKLTHTGFETFPAIPDFAISNFEAGWNDIIHRSLKNYLENNTNS